MRSRRSFPRARWVLPSVCVAATALMVLSAGGAQAVPTSVAGGAPGSPPQHSVFQAGVSCPTRSFCLAVGSSEAEGSAGFRPFSQVWNGRTWRNTPVPSETPDDQLTAVWCQGSGACMAVGSDFHTGAAIFYRWNGRAWLTQPAPSTPHIETLTLAERWNGRTWTRLRSLNP